MAVEILFIGQLSPYITAIIPMDLEIWELLVVSAVSQNQRTEISSGRRRILLCPTFCWSKYKFTHIWYCNNVLTRSVIYWCKCS